MASSTPTADSDVCLVSNLVSTYYNDDESLQKGIDILDRFRRFGFQNVYYVCSTEGRPALPEEVEW